MIARREALSRRGKSADNTKDITRVDVERKKVQNAPSYDAKKAEHCCPECEQKASAITPVPGGVGPMTIACLLRNTTIAFKNSIK